MIELQGLPVSPISAPLLYLSQQLKVQTRLASRTLVSRESFTRYFTILFLHDLFFTRTHAFIQLKDQPIITVYETQANLADHEKIQGTDGAMSRPGT